MAPYLFVLFYFQVDYPVNHDDLIIEVSDYAKVVDGETTRLEYYFKPKNHPNIIHRICTDVTYAIHGRINFSTVRILAHILIILFALILTWYYRRNPLSYLLPILFFVPISQSILWGSAATTYAFPFIFAFLLFIIIPYVDNVIKYVGALVLLLLLTFSFSNSFIGLVLILLYTVFGLASKRIDRTWGWPIAAATIACLFWFYSMPQSETITTPTINLQVLQFPFALSGSLGKYAHFYPELSATLLSIFICAFVSWRLIKNKKWDMEDIILVLMLSFVLITGLAIGITRCSRLVFCTPTANRYEIMGVFGLVCGCLLIGKYYRKSYLLVIGILVLSVIKYADNIADLNNRMHELKHDSTKAYYTGKIERRALRARKANENTKIIKAALERNMIELKDYSEANSSVDKRTACNELEPINIQLTSYGNRDGRTFVSGIIPDHMADKLFISEPSGCVPVKNSYSSSEGLQFYVVTERMNRGEVQFFKMK